MKNELIDVERALEEKKTMQKVFFREHGYYSSVLTLLIAYFEERKEKK
jgi:hypothetical protein